MEPTTSGGYGGAAAWLAAQHLPPLPKFSGESQGMDGETFQDWRDQFELVASVCTWNPQMKLANLVTRLRGQAYSFYRSITPTQRSTYEALVGELTKRFMPVRIQAVQSSLFHERKQGPVESVDDYAQDLRRLLNRAYPQAQRGTSEAEVMAQSVLSSQFVAGVRSSIKTKLAGSEGSLEQLLVRARFEEAKFRDLGERTARSAHKALPVQPTGTPNVHKTGAFTPKDSELRGQTDGRSKPTGGGRCFHCGVTGHYARQCPQRGRTRPGETLGRGQSHSRGSMVAQVGSHEDGQASPQSATERVSDLQQRLRQAELDEALTRVTATMHGIVPDGAAGHVELGPIPTSMVTLQGKETEALLDTGSPVTIVSLDFLLEALAKKRHSDQTPAA